MQTIQSTVIGTLENIKDTIEKRDEDVLKREHVFVQSKESQDEASKQAAENAQDQEPESIEKFKKVSFELLDIGLYYGNQSVSKVKSLPIYQRVDSVINLDEKFGLVKQHGEQLYTMVEEKIKPIVQNVFFLYDQATNSVISYINVITDK